MGHAQASLPEERVVSPNGGSVTRRKRLDRRFAQRLSINPDFTRRTVSYQGNREVPGFRWMKYKEGFSRELVLKLIHDHDPEAVLDPFAGMGTAPLVAAGCGKYAMGIEIMPVGVIAGKGIVQAANGVSTAEFDRVARALLNSIKRRRCAPSGFAFPHVRITQGAFSPCSEFDIGKARRYIEGVGDSGIRMLLNLACMSVLEECSYTRKDGQYLRWDYRSGRPHAKTDMGYIPTFEQALVKRLGEMSRDFEALKGWYGGGQPELVTGSSLNVLRSIPTGRFDMVITSPPYANRYDYTRTYALELAWLGYDRHDFAKLRQQMLTATVENKTKLDWLNEVYSDDASFVSHARHMYEASAVHEVLAILLDHAVEWSNKNVIRLIEGYFFEMAVIVSELGRIVRPGGVVIMVNDNVQYHGEEVPVDFILSDYAEQSGFTCSDIWVLRRGKGNSSQQMARFGRREIRKCVYKWVRTNG